MRALGSGVLEDVFRDIERKEKAIVNDTCVLVNQPSVSARNEGIDECVSLVKSKLRDIGAKVDVLKVKNANPVVFGEMLSNLNSKKTLMFYLYYDVQPPEPLELWKTPPFKASVRNGRIYGRGVHDDKGEIATRLGVVRSFLETLGGELPCSWITREENEKYATSETSFPNPTLVLVQTV